ncbi:Transcription initiation factor TFIID subunit 5 [Podila minutissima]|uniref:Transcription initiation factor TFIID subunit 5 n=1 Tax=Podila minutissima TaxID=64525 RepID=A0A9P5SQQ6_9FUNG|nr:Transcription initiation factor TFIID subunit 5 [Podila minutissima]
MADTTGDGSTGASGTGASATTQSQTSTTATAPATAPQTQQEVDRIVLNYLNQKGYKQAEYVLKREANLMTMEELEASFPLEQGGPIYVMPFEKAEMTSPDAYDVAYSSLRRWVENSLDLYKPELMAVLFPLFIHSYLNLVNRGHKDQAKKFIESYRSDHLEMHSSDIARLATITDPQHVKENELAQVYKTNQYHLRMASVSKQLLNSFLQDNKFMVLLQIVNQHLKIQEGAQGRGDADDFIGIAGHGTHQLSSFNQQPVTLSQMPTDAGLREQVEQTLKEEEIQPPSAENVVNGDTPMLGSLLEEYKKIKTEAGTDIPSRDDIPLPPFKGSDIQAEIEALRESRKRVALGPSSLPSICAYTFHNTHDNINCVAVSEDATLMAAGFSESYVRLWSLKGKKLRGFNSTFKPATIHDSDDLDRIREEHGTDSRKLIGHSGAVFGASFSPDNKYLISCSEDKTARLWSTDTLTNLVAYKGHNYPVWDVDFGPQGFYFATASHDRTARLWSCDHIYPLRIFAGHLSDVDVVKFHPNSKYIVTGSSDKSARLWDVQRGTCVRVFTGHVGAIQALAVSPDGRMMASAGEDRSIQLWDLGSGKRMKKMTGHQGVIYSLDFSQDGTVLVSGSADCTVRAWDVKKEAIAGQPSHRILQDHSGTVGSPTTPATTHQQAVERLAKKQAVQGAHFESEDHLAAFPTKRTPIYKVQFTKRNLCLAIGAFSV